MATSVATTTKRRRIGPRDHGRVMTLEEYEQCYERDGCVAELIDGVLTVSPAPLKPHDIWKGFVADRLKAYAAGRSDIVNHISGDCEVIIPGRLGVTRPRPDIAAYKGFPTLEEAIAHPDWDDICPVLVVEIISRRRRSKDTRRNRHLYWLALGIAEYWIVDPRKDARQPLLVALRRKKDEADWVEQKIPFGKAYKTPTLPGFALNLEEATN